MLLVAVNGPGASRDQKVCDDGSALRGWTAPFV
jgi:hypothetical protein